MADRFRSFDEVQAHLARLGFFHWDLTLERIRKVLRGLGLGRFRPVAAQIVGTNGKGSTAAFLASVAAAHGLRTGLYTSPHFVSIRERVLISGRQLPESDWTLCANLVWRAGGEGLTYFEFVTALAYAAFARAGTEVLVLEAGLGGRNDATTALPADLVVFTPIGLDHENVLGPGLSGIAADKAAALAEGRGLWGALTVSQEQAARQYLQRAAARLALPLAEASEICPLPAPGGLGLAGGHQRGNAQLALAAWRLLAEKHGLPVSGAACRRGLAAAFIPGRLQIAPPAEQSGLPLLILDGGHNMHGLTALAAALAELQLKPEAVIFSGLADKNFQGAGALLSGLAAGPIYVPPVRDNPRAADPAALAAGLGRSALAVPGLETALEMVRQRRHKSALICGSLYLLGEFYTLYPQYLTNPVRAAAIGEAL